MYDEWNWLENGFWCRRAFERLIFVRFVRFTERINRLQFFLLSSCSAKIKPHAGFIEFRFSLTERARARRAIGICSVFSQL